MYSDDQHAVRRRGLAAPYPQDPLRALGGLAQAALAFAVAIGVWEIARIGAQRSIIDRIIRGDTTVTEAEAVNADNALSTASNVQTVALIVAAIGFASWFWRVRRIAGEYDARGQRRSQGWAFWGWVCPVVNLWFPYQIASDALYATPGPKARAVVVLRARWAVWLVALLMNRLAAVHKQQTVEQFKALTTLEIMSAAAQVVAGVLAIVVVALITRSLDRYGDQLRRSYSTR